MAAALLLVPSGSWVALDVRRSAERTTPDGLAAWSRSLQQLGIRTGVRYTSFTADPPAGRGLVLLEPVQAPSAAEVAEVMAWVRGGGVLVYSPQFGGLVMDSLGLGVTLRRVGPGGGGPPGRSRLLRHRWTDGVEEDTLVATWTLGADSTRADTWTPLAVLDSTSATLAWVPEGAGGALIVAEARTLANADLGEAALAVVMTRALADLLDAGDTLIFSEYHQALDGRRGIFRESFALAAASPTGRALLHAAVAAIVLVLLLGRPLGAPIPDPEPDRRSPLEHVEALGRIYEGSSSDQAVARRLVRGAVRRSGQRPTVRDGEREILEAWAGRTELASPARLALAALSRGSSRPPQADLRARHDRSALRTSTQRHMTDPESSEGRTPGDRADGRRGVRGGGGRATSFDPARGAPRGREGGERPGVDRARPGPAGRPGPRTT